MQELITWADAEQAKSGAKYRPWTAEELWTLLEAWEDEAASDGVMVQREANEIFSLA
jgi:hypothetical protein